MTAWLKLNGEYYPMRVIYNGVWQAWNDDIIEAAYAEANNDENENQRRMDTNGTHSAHASTRLASDARSRNVSPQEN